METWMMGDHPRLKAVVSRAEKALSTLECSGNWDVDSLARARDSCRKARSLRELEPIVSQLEAEAERVAGESERAVADAA